MKEILFIVPALNESASIVHVVQSLLADEPHADVLVVDDGSSDGTAELARDAGASVIRIPYNLGIGAAVQTGLMYATRHAYQVAFQVDGDGQHLPSQTAVVLARLKEGGCDVVVGSRFLGDNGYQAPLLRRIGIAIFTVVTSALIRQKISDPTSGFRAFNQRATEFLAEDYPHDFPEPEAIVTLVRNGFTVVEVAVSMQQRQGGRSSITMLRSVYYMSKVLLAILIGATRRRVQR